MKTALRLALACLSTAIFASSAWSAGEVISVNVIGGNIGRAGKSISEGKSAGVVSVPAAFWSQLAQRSGAGAFTETATTLWEWAEGREAPKEVDVGLTLRAACCYTAGSTATNGNAEMLYGYLDDGTTDTGYGAQAVFLSIPYTQYDLYIYLGSDSDGTAGSGFGPVEVNGTWHPAQSTAWGNRAASRQAEATLTENTNYVKVTGLTSPTLTIRGAVSAQPTGTRTGLAGFQIVNTGEALVPRTLTASPKGDATFETIVWDAAAEAPRPIDSVALTLTPGATLTFGTLPELGALSLSSEGSVTLACTAEGATAETLLAGIRSLDLSGVTGTVDVALPASQNLTARPWRYAGGGGTSEKPLQIAQAGGTVAIGGGTYHLGESVSATATTVRVDGATITYTDIFGIGTATYELGGNTTVSTPRLVLSQHADDRAATLTLKDRAALTVTGGTGANENADQNTSAIMFGHWNGPSTFTLRDNATFTAENAQVLVGKTSNTHIINIEGGTFAAKGIKLAGNANGTNTLNLSGGTLRLGDAGLSTFAAANTLAVNVSGTPTLEASADLPVAHAVTLAEGSVLTVKPNGHTVTFAKNFAGTGALCLEGTGTVDLSALTALPIFADVAAGITLRVPLLTDCSELEGRLTGATPTVTLHVQNGGALSGTVEGWYAGAKQNATVTRGEDGSLTVSTTFDTDGTYSGSAWDWDYEFTGNLNNSGAEGTALSQDDGAPVYVTLDETTGNKAVKFKSTPHRTVTYGTAFTVVMRCQPAAVANTALLGFGRLADTCIILATGANPAAGDMRLCLWRNSTLTDLVTGLNVPNATTVPHLYAFTLAVVDGKTQIAVYVDGKRRTVYKADSVITLGSGFQIGSVHGGIVTGLAKYADDEGTLDFLRTTSGTLTMAAMQSIADAYPYDPVTGTATRTVTAEGGDWADAEGTPWQQTLPGQEAVAQAAPNAGTNVTLTAEGEATLALNLSEDVAYESLEVVGSALRLTAAEGNAGTMTVGDLSVRADLTLPLGALNIGTCAVSAGKTLTFDLSGFDFASVWETRTIPLTGLAQLGVGASVGLSGFDAEAIAPRTAEAVFDEKTESYNLVVSVPEGGLTATVTGTQEWSALAWMLGDTPMATPDWAAQLDAVATLRVSGDATLRMDASAAPASLTVEAADAGASLTLTQDGGTLAPQALTLGVDATFGEGAAGVASLGEVSVAEGKTLTVGAMTLSSLNAAGATFATVGTGTTTLKAMVGAPASITVGDGSTLVLPASVSQGGWVTPYVVGAGATLDVNGVYDNSNTSLSLAEGATLTNGGTDVDDSKRQWQNLAIATSEGAVTVSGNTFGSVSSNHNEHFLTLNGGTLNVEMNDGKSFYMANLTVRETAEDTSEDTSEAGTIQVVSGTLRLTHGGDYSRVNLNLSGGEVRSSTEQTFGSLSGTGGTLNLNGQTLTVGTFGKTDVFSGAIVGSGTLTKEGSGTLDLSGVDFRLFEGSFALEAGTLILPAGREKELSQIVSGTTLTLRLSEAQEMAGYTATLPEGLSAEGVTFAFLDAEGTPLTEGVEGNVYVPTQTTAVTWNPTDGWSKEPLAADDSVVIDFKESSGETCPLTVPAGVTLKALAIRGSGTVTLSGNATVAALDVGSGTVSLGGAELTVTGSLEGTAALTLTSGKVVMQNAAVLANAYTGTLTLAGGEWWWGRASSSPIINADSAPPALADSVVVQTGATLALHPWTTTVLTASTTDKVLFSAPITLEGGTFYTEDGSYYLKGPITVNQSSTVRTQWVKGIIVETLTGAANLTWEATTNSDEGEAWNEIRNAPDYSGTLVLKRSGNGTRTLRLTSDTALQQANVIFEDTANRSFFKLTGNRTVGTLSGTGVTVTSDGDANRTLHIANATEEAFSGTITDKINLNIHADAALIMAGTLGTVSGTPQTASYSRSLTLDGTLTFRSVVPTTLTASWSGAGTLIVGDGETPASIAFSGANGGYSGRPEVRTGATLEYNGTSTVPFGKGAIVNDGLVRMTQDSEAQIPPMSGSGDLEVAGSARMAGPLTLSGTVTVAAGKTLTLSRHQTDFTGTPSINGPSLVLGDGAKVVKGEFGEGVTLALGTTLSGAGTVEAPVTFAAGAVVDATAGVPTLTQAVTLPTEGIVSVKAPAEGHGIVLTANGLEAAKFALVEGSARQALTATDTALVLMQLPEGVDASSAAGKAILAAANTANVTNVEKVEGDAIDGAALFTGVVTVDGATATVAYDFGISRMFIRKEGEKEGETTYLYIATKVSTDYAEGTAVKVFQDGTEVEATPVTEGVPNEAGVKWLRVPYVAGESGTQTFTIKAVSGSSEP